MSVDKNYCMSSYLAFRYIEAYDKDFAEGLHHVNIAPVPDSEKVIVQTSTDIDLAIKSEFESIGNKKLGLLLSGGMDSACLASYMPGCEAYTFRFLEGRYQKAELSRAEYYAGQYGLNLHYVDINWESTNALLDKVMEAKAAPVHSIEPQILQAALQAMNDGVEMMVIGESADLIFGGMDGLLAKDWTLEEFMRRYMFTNPSEVLTSPVDMSYLFERYRIEPNSIDFLSFMDDVFAVESSGSYKNAFSTAGIQYLDPYAKLKMADPLDLGRIRQGDSKYLIRDLFRLKYPNRPVPEKVPMPRPVDEYFSDWAGPSRSEFKSDLDLSTFSGNQKWQLYCLERFLNVFVD